MRQQSKSRGFSVIELLIVLGIVAVMSAISIPYLFNYKRLYKSEDQAIKVMDIMRETGQLALTRRRSFRFEIDLTQNAVLVIDENNAAVDTLLKKIPLDATKDVRIDVIPSGVAKPNPPNYTDITFAADAIGHSSGGTTVTGNNVWAARFRSDGSVVTTGGTPINVNIYSFPPASPGNATPRNTREVRAITLAGLAGAIRYWKYTGTAFEPYQ
ncbi:MAG: type II secretion system protein [Pyrinomonadaceae bacterium]